MLCIPFALYKMLLEEWVIQSSKLKNSLEVVLITNLKLGRIVMSMQCNILLSTQNSAIYNSIKSLAIQIIQLLPMSTERSVNSRLNTRLGL